MLPSEASLHGNNVATLAVSHLLSAPRASCLAGRRCINEAAASYLFCIGLVAGRFHVRGATVTSVHFPHIDVQALAATDAIAIQSPGFVSDILTVFDMLLTWLWQRLAGIRFDLLQK